VGSNATRMTRKPADQGARPLGRVGEPANKAGGVKVDVERIFGDVRAPASFPGPLLVIRAMTPGYPFRSPGKREGRSHSSSARCGRRFPDPSPPVAGELATHRRRSTFRRTRVVYKTSGLVLRGIVRSVQSKIQVCHEGVDTDRLRPNVDASVSPRPGLVLRPGDEVVTSVARDLEPIRGLPSPKTR